MRSLLARLLAVTVVTALAAPGIALAQTGSLVANPASSLVGQVVTFTVVLNAPGILPVSGTLAFGDGAATTVPSGTSTVSHAYAAAGTYTATLSVGKTLLATAIVTVTSPVQHATLSAQPAGTFVGDPVTFNASATSSGPAPPLQVDYGDGSSATIASNGATTLTHAYANPGAYVASIVTAGGATLAQAGVTIVAESAQITAVPSTVLVGQRAAFDILTGITPAGAPPATLAVNFGDGSAQQIGYGNAVLGHAYARSGTYRVTVSDPGVVLGSTLVNVDVQTPHVPIGAIYSTGIVGAPALAGGEITVLVNYALDVPASFASRMPDLQLVVDLLGSDGHLVRRSDPQELAFVTAAGPGVRTAEIPYAVPVDATGNYQLRVYLRTLEGATVARSTATPLLVVGAPDPKPAIKSVLHGNGALEIGPPGDGSATNFNAGLTTYFVWPTYTGSLSGLYDPVSRRSDPVFTLQSGTQTQFSNPDAASAPAPLTSAFAGSPGYRYVLGRGNAALPDFMGGGTTLRGIDAMLTQQNWTFHVAGGFTNLATDTTPRQTGDVIDLTRSFARGSAVRFTFFHRLDSLGSVPEGGAPGSTFGPLNADSQSIDLTGQKIGQYLTLSLDGAQSLATPLLGGSETDDSSDGVKLGYARGRNSVTLDYHNAGALFAVGGGPGAQADRAGLQATAQLGLSPVSTLGLSWDREETRSAFSRSATFNATYLLASQKLPNITLSLERDEQLAPQVAQNTDQGTLTVSKSGPNATFSFTASLAGSNDSFTPESDTVTRTAAVQYVRTAGIHTLTLGLDAQSLGGLNANANVSESLSYGWTIGRMVMNAPPAHPFGITLQVNNNTNATIQGVQRALQFAGIVSYHITPHLVIGVHAETHSTFGGTPGNLAAPNGGAIRLRLDFVQ